MIHVKDAEILNILPHTFKTNESIALSKAIAVMTAHVYEALLNVIIWADIDNAAPELLDMMAAETDAPFYRDDMTPAQKRSIIAAAFEFNSRVGTVSSVEALLTATFGGGKLTEWFDYGGEPYHFKVELSHSENIRAGFDDFNTFINNLEKFKNKRSKLDEIHIKLQPLTHTLYLAAVSSIHGHITIPERRYRRYGDIAGMTYEELNGKTYEEILYKE